MKRMKKFAALLLVVAMTFGMVACSSSDKKEESTKKETKTEEKSTKKLDGTLKVVTTGDAYQPLFIIKIESRRWNASSRPLVWWRN